MSRPWMFVSLFLLILFTSQFEWKYQNRFERYPGAITLRKGQHISRRKEAVKEKTIISHEQTIQKLDKLVRSLHKQLLLCRAEHEDLNVTNIL